jgi:hypothetical protein
MSFDTRRNYNERRTLDWQLERKERKLNKYEKRVEGKTNVSCKGRIRHIKKQICRLQDLIVAKEYL